MTHMLFVSPSSDPKEQTQSSAPPALVGRAALWSCPQCDRQIPFANKDIHQARCAKVERYHMVWSNVPARTRVRVRVRTGIKDKKGLLS